MEKTVDEALHQLLADAMWRRAFAAATVKMTLPDASPADRALVMKHVKRLTLAEMHTLALQEHANAARLVEQLEQQAATFRAGALYFTGVSTNVDRHN